MTKKLIRRRDQVPLANQSTPVSATNGRVRGQSLRETQQSAATPRLIRRGHHQRETHLPLATTNGKSDQDQDTDELHSCSVLVTPAEIGNYEKLKLWAEMFFDIQETRKAIDNRIRKAPVDPTLFQPQLEALTDLEKALSKQLVHQYRKTVPAGIQAWQKEQDGIGEHSLARLLGHLGHPRLAFPQHWEGKGDKRKLITDEPFERTIAELRQYAGHGAPMKRRSGMSEGEAAALGNPTVKMLVHIVAEGAMKQPGRDRSAWEESIVEANSNASATPRLSRSIPRSNSNRGATGKRTDSLVGQGTTDNPEGVADEAVWPYRRVYEERRRQTLDKLHCDICYPCGPKGKPAQVGSPWSEKHKHCDALRVVGKRILKDLWLVSGYYSTTSPLRNQHAWPAPGPEDR